MDTSKNGLDAFERCLKDSLEQFEVPYNSADWTQMERALDGGSRGWWVSGVGLSVLVAGFLAVGGTVWYAMDQGKNGEAGMVADNAAVPAMSTSGNNPLTIRTENQSSATSVNEEKAGTEPATNSTPDEQPNTIASKSDPRQLLPAMRPGRDLHDYRSEQGWQRNGCTAHYCESRRRR